MKTSVSLAVFLLTFASVFAARAQAQEHSMTGCPPHLGHKVEITGVAVPGKDKTHTMKVTAVKMISATCP
jgi:hypothetical protein